MKTEDEGAPAVRVPPCDVCGLEKRPWSDGMDLSCSPANEAACWRRGYERLSTALREILDHGSGDCGSLIEWIEEHARAALGEPAE